MHYRNGRQAQNGDKIVQLGSGGTIIAVGILYDAKPGSNFCNGYVASTVGGSVQYACLCDCLHHDDVKQILAEKGLDKRTGNE